eukprot:TRINITY_DN5198_c0_g1::TRINITY_DN5198_c0_g1_i1::g.29311::m.29311 TRINITY_DN5198_c0_g1::TRINITY_DN5198_c0_g1_i1::g.29311  ORF type:complete len:106 (+),score=-8.02,MSSP/PF03940.8/1.1 TRINITY_DN5198_c0_g1_i1:49-366(+)
MHRSEDNQREENYHGTLAMSQAGHRVHWNPNHWSNRPEYTCLCGRSGLQHRPCRACASACGHLTDPRLAPCRHGTCGQALHVAKSGSAGAWTVGAAAAAHQVQLV